MLPLAAIPLAVSALQAGAGAIQAAKGKKKLRGLSRPEYSIPEEVRKNLAVAEQEATYGMDAASKQVATQGIDRTMAASLYGAGTRKAGLAGMGGVVQAGSDAFSNLAAIDQAERARKKAAAMSARSEMAGYKDKEFEVNKMQPYEMGVEEAQSLIGAGMQNVMGGLQTAATTGIYGMSTGDGTMKGMLGGGKTKEDYTMNPMAMAQAFGGKKMSIRPTNTRYTMPNDGSIRYSSNNIYDPIYD